MPLCAECEDEFDEDKVTGRQNECAACEKMVNEDVGESVLCEECSDKRGECVRCGYDL